MFDSFFQKSQFFRSYQKRVQLFRTYWKNSFFESYWKSSNEKNLQFFESYVEKGSVLWVIFWKVFNSLSQIEKKGSHLWVIFKRRVQCLESLWKIFESHSKSSIFWVFWKKVQFFASYSRNEGFNSLRHVRRKKSPILWIDFFFEKKFHSLNQTQKRSILCVICEKKRFHWSHIWQKVYFESHSKVQVFDSLSKIKGLFFESIFKEKFSNFQKQ